VAARFRAGRRGSSLQSKRDTSHGDLITEAHALALLDLHAVHQRAVGAAEIFDPPLLVALLEYRMARGSRLVGHGDVVAGVAPDRVRRAQGKALTDARRLPGAAFDDERAESARLAALRGQRALERSERTEEEQIEQEEE